MGAHQEFPKWKYHAEKDAVIVENKGEELALGQSWHDSPAEFGVETCPAPSGPDARIADNRVKYFSPKSKPQVQAKTAKAVKA